MPSEMSQNLKLFDSMKLKKQMLKSLVDRVDRSLLITISTDYRNVCFSFQDNGGIWNIQLFYYYFYMVQGSGLNMRKFILEIS